MNGVHVHRFPVDYPRNDRLFRAVQPQNFLGATQLSRRVGMDAPTRPNFHESIAIISRINGIRLTFSSSSHTFTQQLIFGLQLVPEKAILVPAAHDEPMLYLPMFRTMFALPRYIIFNTHAERRLVHQVFGNRHIPSSVIGTGINVPDDVSAERFRQEYGLIEPFILYIGRIDKSKNVPELLEYFSRVQADADI